MSTGEWSLAAVHDVVAAAVPDREMLVCGRRAADLRRGGRAVALAGRVPRSRGLGARRERARAGAVGERAGRRRPRAPQLPRVRRGDARRLPGPGGAVQRQPALPAGGGGRPARRPRRPGGRLPPGATARCRRRLRRRPALVLVDVDDGSGVAPLPGSTTFEEAAATPVSTAAAGAVARRPATWCAPAARPAGPRPCCGARPTSTSRPWPGREDATAESIAASGAAGGGRVVRGAAADARGRPVDRVLRPPQRRHRRAPRRLAALRRRGGSSSSPSASGSG